MTAHLTAAQARALGIDVPAPRRRTTRRALPRAGSVSTCHACAATFTTDAAETRHVADTHHHRYDTEMETA